MPDKPKKPCRVTTCPHLCDVGQQYCHKHRSIETRPVASERGYDWSWHKLRQRVLTAYGIPRTYHHLYALDHRPPYDPMIEPDHEQYELVPMIKAEHSRKTAQEDGGFGNSRRRR